MNKVLKSALLLLSVHILSTQAFAESSYEQAVKITAQGIFYTSSIPALISDDFVEDEAYDRLLDAADNTISSDQDPVMYLLMHASLSSVQFKKDLSRYYSQPESKIYVLPTETGVFSIRSSSADSNQSYSLSAPEFTDSKEKWIVFLNKTSTIAHDYTANLHYQNLKQRGLLPQEVYTVSEGYLGFEISALGLDEESVARDIYVLSIISRWVNSGSALLRYKPYLRSSFAKSVLDVAASFKK